MSSYLSPWTSVMRTEIALALLGLASATPAAAACKQWTDANNEDYTRVQCCSGDACSGYLCADTLWEGDTVIARTTYPAPGDLDACDTWYYA